MNLANHMAEPVSHSGKRAAKKTWSLRGLTHILSSSISLGPDTSGRSRPFESVCFEPLGPLLKSQTGFDAGTFRFLETNPFASVAQ